MDAYDDPSHPRNKPGNVGASFCFLAQENKKGSKIPAWPGTAALSASVVLPGGAKGIGQTGRNQLRSTPHKQPNWSQQFKNKNKSRTNKENTDAPRSLVADG